MSKKQVPIEKDLFILRSPAQQSYLVGSKCKSCGEVFSPKQPICARCSGEETEEISLSRRGKVYSSTVLRYPPPLYKGPTPIPVGYVELPEAVIVPTVFTDCDVDKPLEIGTPVEMEIEQYGVDEEGNEVMVYKFRPVKK